MAEQRPLRRSPLNSAAFRFALAFAGVFACAAFLLVAQVRHQIGAYAREATVGSLQNEAATLIADRHEPVADEIRRRMIATPLGTFAYLLVDPQGRPVIGRIPLSAARPGPGRVVMRERDPRPNEREYLEELVTLGTRLNDGSLLVVATDGYDIDWIGRRMVRWMVAGATAITLLALIAGWAAARLFLNRLDAANTAIERIMAGRTDQRLPMIGLGPELDDLSRNLNRMLDRIDGLMEGLRQVSTDVAHDLRTPLTRLRQILESARDAASRDEMDADIGTAIDQADHLLATFRAILRLAQIEGGGRRAPFEPVDLGALLEGLIEIYEPVAADADHNLSPPAPIRAVIQGDDGLLTQLFTNLIENAILHTPAGTRIAVEIERRSAAIAVTVADNGPGVAAEQRAMLTRRFYQADPSRSGGSAGLGLSMASAIVQLHGATLDIGDAGPGLRVSILFPLPDGEAAE